MVTDFFFVRVKLKDNQIQNLTQCERRCPTGWESTTIY